MKMHSVILKLLHVDRQTWQELLVVLLKLLVTKSPKLFRTVHISGCMPYFVIYTPQIQTADKSMLTRDEHVAPIREMRNMYRNLLKGSHL